MADSKLNEQYQADELVELHFASGIRLEGRFKSEIKAKDGCTRLVLTFTECTVFKDDKIYFDPSWGEFDLALGTAIPSVYGGPADWQAYGDYDMGKASTQPGRKTPFTVDELALFKKYETIRFLRSQNVSTYPGFEKEVKQLAKSLIEFAPNSWLLAMELLELMVQKLKLEPKNSEEGKKLLGILTAHETKVPPMKPVIETGLSLISVPD